MDKTAVMPAATATLAAIVDGIGGGADTLHKPVQFEEQSDAVHQWDELYSGNAKRAFDYDVRQLLYTLAREGDANIDKICALFDLMLHLSSLDRCDFGMVHGLIEELFDIQTTQWCQKFWPYMVSRERQLCQNLTGTRAPGTTLIRLCNSLVKRLSKNQDALFSGEIALYLSRAFPLGEKSGLNIRGSFNTENVTIVQEQPAALDDQAMDVDDDSKKNGGRDACHDFWSIQAYFSDPPQLFDADNLGTFKTKTSRVLDILRDAAPPPGKKQFKRPPALADQGTNTEEVFAPKWLTSPDLFDLQLRDSSFRLTVLSQLYILSDFLLSLTEASKKAVEERIEIRNKSIHYTFTLSTEDASFFEDVQEQANLMARGTLGQNRYDNFMALLQSILRSDKNWQDWKLQNCPSFEKPSLERAVFAQAMAKLEEAKKPRARFWHSMGTAALSKVWKIEPGVDKLKRSTQDMIPMPEEYQQRAVDAKNKDDAFENDEEKQAAVASLEWRGLRAARDHGLWGDFVGVTKDSGFGGLFKDNNGSEEQQGRQGSVGPAPQEDNNELVSAGTTPAPEKNDSIDKGTKQETATPGDDGLTEEPAAADDGASAMDETPVTEEPTDESPPAEGSANDMNTTPKRKKSEVSLDEEVPSAKRQHVDEP